MQVSCDLARYQITPSGRRTNNSRRQRPTAITGRPCWKDGRRAVYLFCIQYPPLAAPPAPALSRLRAARGEKFEPVCRQFRPERRSIPAWSEPERPPECCTNWLCDAQVGCSARQDPDEMFVKAGRASGQRLSQMLYKTKLRTETLVSNLIFGWTMF